MTLRPSALFPDLDCISEIAMSIYWKKPRYRGHHCRHCPFSMATDVSLSLDYVLANVANGVITHLLHRV